MSKPKTRVLGTFTLAMITLAAIVSLRNLSFIAGLGISAVFFVCVAGLIFFLPTAFVIAELAAAWPKPGGCYVWVGEAFGKPLAFFTLWTSWMTSVVWFPTILIFTAAMLAHMLHPLFPHLELSREFILLSMLATIWGATIVNFYGIEFSGFISSCGVIAGTLIPGVLIIFLGLWWVGTGHDSVIPLSIPNLLPDLNIDNLTLFSGVLISLAGIELAAFHVREAKDPQHSYPRAVLLASAAILLIYILGTLSIAIVVPPEKLSLASGLIQAFAVFFKQVGMAWIIPLLAAFIFLGAIAGVNAWVAGPAKGMLVVAEDGFLPPWLHKVNHKGVPTSLLLIQAIVVSVLSILFIMYMNNNTSIWILTALSAQFTCLMYVLIFLAALKLRYKQPHTPRPFKVSAIWPVACCGIGACIFSFVIVYVPHSQLVSIQNSLYNTLLFSIFLLLLLPTLLLMKFRIRSRRKTAK